MDIFDKNDKASHFLRLYMSDNPEILKGAPPVLALDAAKRMSKARDLFEYAPIQAIQLFKEARTQLLFSLIAIDRIMGMSPNLEAEIKVLTAHMDMYAKGQ